MFTIQLLYYPRANLQASMCSLFIHNIVCRDKLQASVCSLSVHYFTLELSCRLVVQCQFTLLH